MKYLTISVVCLLCAAWGIYVGYGLRALLSLP